MSTEERPAPSTTEDAPLPTVVHRSGREDAEATRVVDEAVGAFWRTYTKDQVNPVVVVIAALNEAASIGAVVDEVPDRLGGSAVSVLVIDDGSTDATSDVSAEHGALVCRLRANCGQGTAFRCGYRVAIEGGARYVATLDGDGQWDASDLPAMFAILERGEADFVAGSRRLGVDLSSGTFRGAGVRFFARAISLATGVAVTDSSSGLRAMRVEVVRDVPRIQPQYQSSELLIGAISRGFRYAEVPTVMRSRLVGKSRKGNDLLYGLRYATVIATTVLRERRAARLRK